jgi:trypsin
MNCVLKFVILIFIQNGFVFGEKDGKIVGGVAIEITQAPYQVSIARASGTGFYHVCGGSIITNNIILTAAHCTFADSNLQQIVPARNFRVRIGSKDSRVGGEIFEVSGFVNHPEFSKNIAMNYDFSLFGLTTRIIFDYVRKAPIPLGDFVNDNAPVFITGFGTTASSGSSSRYLLGTVVNVVNQGNCYASYQRLGQLITNQMICAAARGKDTCQG